MDLIKSINNKFKIIIIQNCKSELGGVKRIYKNVEIIKNRINSGNGAAINIGLKKTFTKFCLYLDIDIVLEKNFLKKINY